MTESTSARRRVGFTLIETIVTVGLIAVLAAFVIPTVIQKASAGDPVKVANDLMAIRTGLESFANDTKAGYPNQVAELAARPALSNHLIDSATVITSAIQNLWNGPYLSITMGSTPADSIATGFGGFIKNYIARYNATTNAAEHYISGVGTGGVYAPAAGDPVFAALTVVGLTTAQARMVNRLIDGADDADAVSGANTTGRFRYDVPISGHTVAYFLATPVIP